MAIDAAELEKYDGKQVVLHRIMADGTVSELEGKVEAASVVGVAFKEKGKRDVELLLPAEIEEIALAPEKAKRITQKKLKVIVEANVRQHLADRHGMSRTQVNDMTDEDAAKLHDSIDHTDLGHKHVSDEDDENEADETA